MTRLLFSILLTCTTIGQRIPNKGTSKQISDVDAGKHIGEICTVVGRVNSYLTLNSSKMVLLFCGTKISKPYFTVIVQNGTGRHLPLKDLPLAVSGLIFKYKDMPAIKVTNWKEIKRVLLVDKQPPGF
jgi:hypothetical protein